MKLFALGAALAISAAAVGAASGPQAAVPASPEKDVKIVGCVVKGEGGYVLMPLAEHGGAAAALPPAATSGSAGEAAASGTADLMQVLYWLDDDDEVDDHAGQRVEITGELDDDIDRGEVKVEREDDGLTKVEFKREGKTISVKLPNVPGAIATSGGDEDDDERKFEYAVREVNVKNVKMLASTCQ